MSRAPASSSHGGCPRATRTWSSPSSARAIRTWPSRSCRPRARRATGSASCTATRMRAGHGVPLSRRMRERRDDDDAFRDGADRDARDAARAASEQPEPVQSLDDDSYYLPERMQVRLDVYDVSGRLVARLADGDRSAATRSCSGTAAACAASVRALACTTIVSRRGRRSSRGRWCC